MCRQYEFQEMKKYTMLNLSKIFQWKEEVHFNLLLNLNFLMFEDISSDSWRTDSL